jgi:hypothetical protein
MLSAAHTWSLTAIAFASGVAMLWVFGRFSNAERIRLAQRKIRANLYAFRLFADEPALIFRAQKQLLLWNARYLGLMLGPSVAMFVPAAVLLTQLEAVYGSRPLEAGESAIVTAQFDASADSPAFAPSLEGHGILVETPAVRIPDRRQACWRVRAISGRASVKSGSVWLRVPGADAGKTVQAGTGLCYISARRVASLFDWLHYPAEARLPDAGVRWIGVSYPYAAIDVFGFGVDWLVWFCTVSLLTMLAFRKRFGVAL